MIFEIASYINAWFPWFSFINFFFFLQLSIIYTLICFVLSSNLYNALFYMFIQIILFGFFLSLFSLEVFVAFLWLTEIVIILVSIFILFSSAPSGDIKVSLHFSNIYKNLFLIIFIFIISYIYTSYYLSENFFSEISISAFYWDNYYEALFNENMNDLYGLFISFYWINSIEFIIIGLVLLFGSLACVQLNRFIKNNKTVVYSDLFTLFDFFKDMSKHIFIRKQNLIDQLNNVSSTRIFKKKNKK